MKNIILSLFIFGSFWALQAQEPKDAHGAWQVTKEFDEEGNLIRYDSVYRFSTDINYSGYNQEMLDSLFGEIPGILAPISKDMSEFFDNDPFFSQIFGSKGNPELYAQPFSMKEFEDMLRSDSLDLDEDEIDKMLEEMDRIRLDVMKQLRGQPKVPEEKRDSLR